MTRAVRKAGSVIFKNPFLLYLLCFILHTMHFNKDSHDNPVQNGVPSKFCVKQRLQKPVYNLTQACAVKVIAAFNWVLLVVLVCKWSLHVEPHFFFLLIVFIEKLAKWRYWNGHCVFGGWICCVFTSAILRSLLSPLFDWTVYCFPGSKALKIHRCNGPAFMQLVHSSTLVGTLRDVCVCEWAWVCVCVCTLWWVLLMLEVHSGFRDGYSDIKKLSLHFSPLL